MISGIKLLLLRFLPESVAQELSHWSSVVICDKSIKLNNKIKLSFETGIHMQME